MMLARALLAVVAAALLAAACGDDAGDRLDRGGPVPELALDPTAGDEIVFSVDHLAGFVTALDAVRLLPSIVVYGDGRLVQDVSAPLDGGETAAVPAIEERQLTDDGLAVLLERVAAAGVTRPVAFGDPLITDLDTLRLQIVVGDEVVENAVYAPGFSEGLSGDQRAAREAVEALVADLEDLDGLLGDGVSAARPAAVDRWLAFTGSTDRFADSGPGAADALLARDWPLSRQRAAEEAVPLVCTELEGADRDTVLDAARSQFVATLWMVEDGTGVDLVLRPVLDGADCTSFPEFERR
jgi:hypothetical protein